MAFNNIKILIAEETMLTYPIFNLPNEDHVDTTNWGSGNPGEETISLLQPEIESSASAIHGEREGAIEYHRNVKGILYSPQGPSHHHPRRSQES